MPHVKETLLNACCMISLTAPIMLLCGYFDEYSEKITAVWIASAVIAYLYPPIGFFRPSHTSEIPSNRIGSD